MSLANIDGRRAPYTPQRKAIDEQEFFTVLTTHLDHAEQQVADFVWINKQTFRELEEILRENRREQKSLKRQVDELTAEINRKRSALEILQHRLDDTAESSARVSEKLRMVIGSVKDMSCKLADLERHEKRITALTLPDAAPLRRVQRQPRTKRLRSVLVQL